MEKMNINITTEYIKLDQLLKFSALAESGAMAKDMIFDGIVSVLAVLIWALVLPSNS